MPFKKWGLFLTVYVFSIGLSFYFGKNIGLATHASTSQKITAEKKEKLVAEPTHYENQKSEKNIPEASKPGSQDSITSADSIDENTSEKLDMIAYETCEKMIIAKQQASQVGQFISRANSENVSPIDLADDKFEQEAIDHQWAIDKERAIYGALENDDDLRNVTPLSITCRSQNCRVVLAYDDQIHAQKLSGQFRAALSKESKSVTWLVDESSGELVFYMGSDSSLFQ